MTSYQVGPAASNRASCKGCKAKIDKGALRVGTVTPGPGDYDVTSWRHLECQKHPKNLTSLDELAGFSGLDAVDKAKVEAWFNNSGVGAKKRSADEVESVAQLNPKKMKAAEMKKTLKANGIDATGSKDELQGKVQETVKRAAAEAHYMKMTVPQLKAVLEANTQLKGGAKQELLDRCVDGKVYGALPRCPQCGGGVLRVVYPSQTGHGGQGKFSCPGYYDDDHFVRCNFKAEHVERLPWVEP